MPENAPPFAVNYDLARLPEAGREIVLAPTAAERAAIARWAGVIRFDTLKGKVRLEKLGGGYFGYEAEFTADVVQACVVTLETVHAKIAREFRRTFHVPEKLRKRAAKRPARLTTKITVDEDEPPEELPATVFDVAGPVLEELNLAIDPYPRKPGATFAGAGDKDAPAENPFAVLNKLKTKR